MHYSVTDLIPQRIGGRMAHITLFFVFLLGTGCLQAEPNSADTNNLTQAVATIEALRAAARYEPGGTIQRLALPNAQQQFNKLTKDLWLNVVPEEGWSNFFASAVYSIAFTPNDCLVSFYHPWADVVLVTLWEKQQTGVWRVADIDVLLGDFVRRQGKPPYDLTPAWTLDKRIPPLAVADITQTTFDAFARVLASPGHKISTLREWRSAFLNSGDAAVVTANHLGAGKALETNIRGLLEFLRDKPVSNQIDVAVAKLNEGNLDEVLNAATATPKETGELLRQYMRGRWSDLHLACYAGRENTRFILFETKPPDSFVSFAINAPKQGAPSIARLDFVNHRVYREFLNAKHLKEGTE